jgi:hypothetical protein
MANQYYNRYQNFILNGTQRNIPYVKLPPKSTDKVQIYRVGITRLDKVSQTFYGTPYFGWLILQANPEYGGSEIFPLTSSLLDYKSALDNYSFYYGK